MLHSFFAVPIVLMWATQASREDSEMVSAPAFGNGTLTDCPAASDKCSDAPTSQQSDGSQCNQPYQSGDSQPSARCSHSGYIGPTPAAAQAARKTADIAPPGETPTDPHKMLWEASALIPSARVTQQSPSKSPPHKRLQLGAHPAKSPYGHMLPEHCPSQLSHQVTHLASACSLAGTVAAGELSKSKSTIPMHVSPLIGDSPMASCSAAADTGTGVHTFGEPGGQQMRPTLQQVDAHQQQVGTPLQAISPATDLSMDVVDLTADSPEASHGPNSMRSSVQPSSQNTSTTRGSNANPQPAASRKTTQRLLPSSWGIRDKMPAAAASAAPSASCRGTETTDVQKQADCGVLGAYSMPEMRKSIPAATAYVSLKEDLHAGCCKAGSRESLPRPCLPGGDAQPATSNAAPCSDSSMGKIRDPIAEMAAAGVTIGCLKEVLPEEIRWGQVRLAIAHISRTGLLCCG